MCEGEPSGSQDACRPAEYIGLRLNKYTSVESPRQCYSIPILN